MHRAILAGCLMLAHASLASSQSTTPSDEAPSPMEILAALAPASPAAVKADPKTDATKKASTGMAAEPKVDPLAQCLRDWDAGTHMTRQEWARTCRRVVGNRAKFLSAQEGN
jgi:hypothetical protein